MNILNNKGIKCDKKFINTIGSVNIDCVNKFIKEYSTLVNSSTNVSLIAEDIRNLSDVRRIKERLNTVNIYSNIYKKAFKNCIDINRVLNDNGTLDKLNNYSCFYKDEDNRYNKLYNTVIYNEFNLIKDYFNDYQSFLFNSDYDINNLDELESRYKVISEQCSLLNSNLNNEIVDYSSIKKIKRR